MRKEKVSPQTGAGGGVSDIERQREGRKPFDVRVVWLL